LSGRKVLISLVALGHPDWKLHKFPVNLTCEQVRNSPEIDTKMPVHRQHEAALHEYYLWPRYWDGGYGGTFNITPYPLFEEPLEKILPVPHQQEDPNLRSSRQVTNYHIHATDGEIGHVEDFIVDDGNWALRFLVVNTGNWLPGKKVLISPDWITKVDWASASVYLKHPREAVKNSCEINSVE
jgi:hypothetical protein